jgi:AcrR family transcriptional regulator
MPRPRSLSPRQIADAALAVLDREGASGLSMRAVAAELRMSTMGLYRYVADRDELERLIVDLVLGELDFEVPAEGPWRERIGELAHRAREAVARHPAAVPLLLIHRQDAENSLRWGEAMLTVLAQAGFEDAARATAFRALMSYVLGALQLQSYGPLDGAGTKVLAELPPERFPQLALTARAARSIDPREEFRTGLDALLRGLRPPAES